MNGIARMRVVVVVCGLVCVAGLAVGVNALVQVRRDQDVWTARRGDLDALQALGARRARFDMLQERVREGAGTQPEPDTAVLLREAYPQATPDISVSRLRVNGGWSREDVELALSNASVARIFQFVEAAERARPPLRLVRVDIRSRPGAGQVDAVLSLVRLIPDA